ncbi:MAG: Rne/Rng family ribonuclease [Myxococcota bacterium]
MSTEIIINSTGGETRIATVENGQMTELHVDRGHAQSQVGNVYLGKVVRVLPGMQAAFVDIGLERAAFLYVGDIYAEPLKDSEDSNSFEDPEGTIAETAPSAAPKHGMPPIQDLISQGDELLVQVAKDPISTKGARIKTHITLPGRFTVFMPTVDHVGISRRIDRDRERRKLREFVEKQRPPGCGYIVRTVCSGQPLEALKQDMDYLQSTWEKIKAEQKTARAPALIHADHGLVLRVIRDSFTENVQRVLADTKKDYRKIRDFIRIFAPHLLDRIHNYRGSEPIFDYYGLEVQINQSLSRKVWLKSGGYIIIDQTEALTAIDVNSGRFVGNNNLEDTTLTINLEAVAEIGNQLRLRNIGGIIVIDFIDMEKAQNRDRVYRAMEEQLRKDRARTNLLKISELGLIEMTRKRVQEDLVSSISDTCPYCSGTGHIKSIETIVYDVIREVHRESHRARPENTNIFVNANPSVADELYGREFGTIESLEQRFKRNIVIRALGNYHIEQFEVYSR